MNESYARQTIYIKCLVLFSLKKKKLSAAIVIGVLMAKKILIST